MAKKVEDLKISTFPARSVGKAFALHFHLVEHLGRAGGAGAPRGG